MRLAGPANASEPRGDEGRGGATTARAAAPESLEDWKKAKAKWQRVAKAKAEELGARTQIFIAERRDAFVEASRKRAESGEGLFESAGRRLDAAVTQGRRQWRERTALRMRPRAAEATSVEDAPAAMSSGSDGEPERARPALDEAAEGTAALPAPPATPPPHGGSADVLPSVPAVRDAAYAPSTDASETEGTWAGVMVERLREAGGKIPKAPKRFPHISIEVPPFIREFNEQIKGGFPSRRRLDIVQEFFKYTEDEGRAFFDAMDANGDGVVTLADMKEEMRRRNLPERYATNFIRRAKRHAKWPLGNSISWEDFRSVMQEREAAMLKAFNSLEVSQFGSLKRQQIKTLLHKMQFPATDDNAESMLKYLDAEKSGYISYGKFRNFLILVPKDQFLEKDIGSMWYESATMIPIRMVPANASRKMLILSTIASAAISGSTTLALHPIDTLKTRLQASSGQSVLTVIRNVKSLGGKALYRGVIPATVGAASSQGFRVGIFEATRLASKLILPGIPDIQVQTAASGMGAVVGTIVRIPCEVLKQRLQAGQHPGVGAALGTVIRADGLRGFFRGSAATLWREIPFYVLGMVAYEQLKKAATKYSKEKRGKDLEPWETIAVGALSGAIAACLTTPADVLKTRLMTSAVGEKTLPIEKLFTKMLQEEGIGSLFKGALPRALWIAPLGALNFAGYELAKNAMSGSDSD